ncbi:MAG: tRNA 2-selenouridine(34) synthase MnmH [Bacteroidota bacterium]
MGIEKLKIEAFLQLAQLHPVLDVRSSGEYTHAHIPNAFNLPLFDDEERKVVGTAYKQNSREEAIKIGLDYFGVKMRKMVEQVEQISTTKVILVHCWRGGMRSAAVAWLLDLYGFKVYTLAGGYKAYRQWAFAQFEIPYPFKMIGGYTGSGKTLVLHELKKAGYAIIDLEGITHHKGSAFGALGQPEQPSQEMFENILAMHLYQEMSSLSQKKAADIIWMEDESQRIGLVNIPNAFWNTMRSAPLYFLDVPFEERLNYITQDYGIYDKDKLVTAILRIQKRLGNLDTKNAINFLLENNTKECFRILLKYYDKYYIKALNSRDELNELLHNIVCESVNTKVNTQKIKNSLLTL